MKNQKGITLTSLGIYVVICILVVAMLATITANYKSAIKSMDNEAEYSSEYSKFNLYFLEEVKKQENQKKPTITKENNNNYNSIKFETGNEFKHDAQKEILYLNKNTGEKIKLIKNVKLCSFELNSENGKDIIKVNIQIGDTESRAYNYVLDGQNSTELYSTENEYIEGITKIPVGWDSSKLNKKDPFRTEKMDTYYNIAPIPVGYEVSTVDGEDKISTGLIITDGTNRFKWHQKNELLEYNEGNYETNWSAEVDITNLTSTNAIYESLKESEELYGGAYIKETETTETIKAILWIK